MSLPADPFPAGPETAAQRSWLERTEAIACFVIMALMSGALLAPLFAPDQDPGGSVTSGGYAAVVGFARATRNLQGEVTPQSVASAIRSMAEATMPLSDALTFRCDGSAVTIAKAICSTATLVGTLDADGVPGAFERIETAELLKLG